MTKNYQKHSFIDGFVRIWDTKGYTEDDNQYEEKYIEKCVAMMQGKVKDKTVWDDIETNKEEEEANKIHVVIFLMSPYDKNFEAFKKIHQKAEDLKIPSYFALSKLDEEEKHDFDDIKMSAKNFLCSVQNCSKFNEFYSYFCRTFKDTSLHSIFSYSVCCSAHRQPKCDISLLHFLHTIFEEFAPAVKQSAPLKNLSDFNPSNFIGHPFNCFYGDKIYYSKSYKDY